MPVSEWPFIHCHAAPSLDRQTTADAVRYSPSLLRSYCRRFQKLDFSPTSARTEQRFRLHLLQV